MADPSESEDALNAFLRSKRVLQITKSFREAGPLSSWEILVDYVEPGLAGGAGKNGSRARPRVDYKELLPPEAFARFARLRELRKKIAEEEAIPAYAIFTNEQLAALAEFD